MSWHQTQYGLFAIACGYDQLSDYYAFSYQDWRPYCQLNCVQWRRSVVKSGVMSLRSNCFRFLHHTSMISKHSTTRFLTACRRLEKLVLHSILDTNISCLTTWKLATTVLNERMWGVKTYSDPSYIFSGVRIPAAPSIYAPDCVSCDILPRIAGGLWRR